MMSLLKFITHNSNPFVKNTHNRDDHEPLLTRLYRKTKNLKQHRELIGIMIDTLTNLE